MTAVTVGKDFQISLPAEVRRHLGIKQGDRLLVHVRGDHILLMRQPDDYSGALAGLDAELWNGVDPQEYIRREREAWTD